MLCLGLFLGHILMNAAGDAFYDSGLKSLAGIFYAVLAGITFICIIGSVLDIPIRRWRVDWAGVIWLCAGYICLRYSLFDPVYNLLRDLDPFYIGSTKLVDKFWTWFFNWTLWPAFHWFLVTRVMSLLFGVHTIYKGIQ